MSLLPRIGEINYSNNKIKRRAIALLFIYLLIMFNKIVAIINKNDVLRNTFQKRILCFLNVA